MTQAEQYTTKEEILGYGDHLNEVRTILAAGGLAILQNVGCIHEHVGQEQAETVLAFLGGPLREIIGTVDAQLTELSRKYDVAEAEVQDLEAVFSQPDNRPGQGGYL